MFVQRHNYEKELCQGHGRRWHHWTPHPTITVHHAVCDGHFEVNISELKHCFDLRKATWKRKDGYDAISRWYEK